MGARPLRRAIQRYIEDPLADEVLKSSYEPGSTVEVDTEAPVEDADGETGVKVSIIPPVREREAVGVGAAGGSAEAEGGEGSSLPDEPEVLPDVPDAPPEEDGEPDEQGGAAG
jgi:ATP-dependent Clp protease ATP-binding subunit ClpC